MDMMQGEDKFVKKLIPYIFMSKDDLPESLTPEKVLSKIYEFVEEWKSKLFNIISSDMTRAVSQVWTGFYFSNKLLIYLPVKGNNTLNNSSNRIVADSNIMKGTTEAIYNTEKKEDRTSQVKRLSGDYFERKKTISSNVWFWK